MVRPERTQPQTMERWGMPWRVSTSKRNLYPLLHGLHGDADHTTERGANGHRGHEDTSRDLGTIRDDDKARAEDRGEEE